MSDSIVDYYAVLGVEPTATDKQIRKAYFEKARVLHPDKVKNPTPASVREFEAVQLAYSVLSDAGGRAALDAVLGAQVRAQQRVAALSTQRRHLQEELERREREAALKAELGRAHALLRQHTDRIRAENLARMHAASAPVAAAASAAPVNKRERNESGDAAVVGGPAKKSDTATLVPHSQRFASLEDFEAYAYERLSTVK